MQKQKAVMTGQILLKKAKPETYQGVMVELSKHSGKFSIMTNASVAPGPNNRWTALIDFCYGPVWGCWESDIRKIVKSALKHLNSSPEFDLISVHRKVVEVR